LKAAPVRGALLAALTYTPESQLASGARRKPSANIGIYKIGPTELQWAFVTLLSSSSWSTVPIRVLVKPTNQFSECVR
jgi:hypothetical protein